MTSPVTIRASSFGALFDCPSRWAAIHLEGRRVPSTGAAALGRAVHRGTAVYDAERVAGRLPSLTAATDAAAQAIEQPDEDTDWHDDSPATAKDIAVSLTARYCREISQLYEFVAVEISVNSLHLTDLGLVLTGHTDRVRRTDAGIGIVDIKTGKSAVDKDGRARTKGHAAQLGVYELVAEAALGARMDLPGQILGMQTNVTPDKQRIGSAEIVGAREVLVGTDDQTGLLHIAAMLVHGQIPLWGNPQSRMCHERYCPNFKTCFFRR